MYAILDGDEDTDTYRGNPRTVITAADTNIRLDIPLGAEHHYFPELTAA